MTSIDSILSHSLTCNLLPQIPIVRVNAVISLEYLQIADSECPVIAALLDLIGRDSSPDVRRCILNKIAVTDKTLAGER